MIWGSRLIRPCELGAILCLAVFLTASVNGQELEFNPQVSTTINGKAGGSTIYADGVPEVKRTTFVLLTDDLPGTRTLRLQGVNIDFSSLAVGSPVFDTHITVAGTVDFGGTLIPIEGAATAEIRHTVAQVDGDSVTLEGIIDDISINPAVEMLPQTTPEVLAEVNLLLGSLATIATLTRETTTTALGAGSGGEEFLLSETFNFPPGTVVSDTLLDLDARVTATDTFAPGLIMLQAGSSVTLTSQMTSFNQGLSIDPVVEQFAITAAQLVAYFPLFESDPDHFAGFAASNSDPVSANVRFIAYKADGKEESFVRNPAEFLLEGSTQLAQLDFEIFRESSLNSRAAWIQLEADNTSVGTFTQLGTNSLTQLDGANAITSQATKLYFTRVHEGTEGFRGQPATTTLSIANPNGEEIALALKLIGPGAAPAGSGMPVPPVVLAEQTRTIPAKGFLRESVSEIFGDVSVSNGYVDVEVTEGTGAVGTEKIQLTDQETVIVLNASAASESSDAFSAQLASVPSILFTNANLINVGTEERSLTLTAVGNEGQNLADPFGVVLGPGEFFHADAATLFAGTATASQGISPSGTTLVGSFTVAADGGGVIGDVEFGDPSGFTNAAALPLQTQKFLKAVFSHVANVPGLFFTGLALFNPGADTANVTIEVFAPDGTLKGTRTLELTAGARLSQTVPELAPDTEGQAGGYILITSDQPLIAQELFGTLSGSLLSSVPPLILEGAQ